MVQRHSRVIDILWVGIDLLNLLDLVHLRPLGVMIMHFLLVFLLKVDWCRFRPEALGVEDSGRYLHAALLHVHTDCSIADVVGAVHRILLQWAQVTEVADA